MPLCQVVSESSGLSAFLKEILNALKIIFSFSYENNPFGFLTKNIYKKKCNRVLAHDEEMQLSEKLKLIMYVSV